MLKNISMVFSVALLMAAQVDTAAYAEAGYLKPLRRAQQHNWHANYAHSAYGQPVALIVPPTVQLQTNWSWGSPSAHFSRVDHQFGRNCRGPGQFGSDFRRTPRWPNNTHQLGVYYVRGPWYPTQP